MRTLNGLILVRRQQHQQSLSGKAPIGVARRTSINIPVIAICGSLAEDLPSLPFENIQAAFSILEKSEPLEEIDHLNNSSRLISLGINLEKERMIDEAISVYEKAIIPKKPVKHPYERLAILYRKRKDYINEIRVLTDAISVFMKENERRAGLVFDKDNSLHDMVMRAIERNESIKYEDGKWAFIQYDVMELITRLEKAKTLLGKSNINEGRK